MERCATLARGARARHGPGVDRHCGLLVVYICWLVKYVFRVKN